MVTNRLKEVTTTNDKLFMSKIIGKLKDKIESNK